MPVLHIWQANDHIALMNNAYWFSLFLGIGSAISYQYYLSGIMGMPVAPGTRSESYAASYKIKSAVFMHQRLHPDCASEIVDTQFSFWKYRTPGHSALCCLAGLKRQNQWQLKLFVS
jgi:hypothetical protein